MKLKKIKTSGTAFLICMGILFIVQGYGQSDNKAPFMKAMQEMVSRYRDSKYLSFEITFKYTSEQNPGTYLDSLTGRYKLNGNNYWYSLDNTEVIGNKDYSVLLFKEDHIMYLAPPAAKVQHMDFLSSLDSFLVHQENISPSLEEEQDQKKLLLSFGKNPSCKSIEYDIDRHTGYITRIRQIVKAGQLYDPSVRSSLESDSSYAVIDMFFSNYSGGSFDTRPLDVSSYFKKEGQQFVTVPPYDAYKIFLGAPNL